MGIAKKQTEDKKQRTKCEENYLTEPILSDLILQEVIQQPPLSAEQSKVSLILLYLTQAIAAACTFSI